MAQGTLAPNLTSEAEAILARETSLTLASRLSTTAPLQLRMVDEPSAGTVKLPASAVQMLVHMPEEMARGNAVTLIPIHPELTSELAHNGLAPARPSGEFLARLGPCLPGLCATQEAADLLNKSRPSLIQVLDGGKTEYRRVGTHRRVRLEGLMAYKRRLDAERRAVLAELAAYDQELGL
ncbi:MAG: DNA-binding protein [Acidobacteria bacterium]|nr:DNA-binding protein [Acidobacteriota bacterium]